MTSQKSAVFVGNTKSVFVSRTRETLCANGIPVTIIDPYSSGDDSSLGGILGRILRIFRRYQSVKKAMIAHSSNQTAVLHHLSIDSFWLIPLLTSHFDRVIAVAYGSDILRRVKSRDWLLRIGLKKLDGVAATNNNVLDTLVADFPFIAGKEHRLIRFGLPVFDALDSLREITTEDAKRLLNFDPSRFLVSLGYSASPGQQQLNLVDFFTTHSRDFSHIQFVVPIQYGPADIIAKVLAACASANAHLGKEHFVAITEFFDTKNSALLRKSTDVLINNSISDAFSGTIQEVVYAGNLVLAAEHLPYRSMPGFGTAIKHYDTLDTAASALSLSGLRSWRRQAQNAEISNRDQLHRISSWQAVFKDWQSFINGTAK